jgi:hypothetical protein
MNERLRNEVLLFAWFGRGFYKSKRRGIEGPQELGSGRRAFGCLFAQKSLQVPIPQKYRLHQCCRCGFHMFSLSDKFF